MDPPKNIQSLTSTGAKIDRKTGPILVHKQSITKNKKKKNKRKDKSSSGSESDASKESRKQQKLIVDCTDIDQFALSIYELPALERKELVREYIDKSSQDKLTRINLLKQIVEKIKDLENSQQQSMSLCSDDSTPSPDSNVLDAINDFKIRKDSKLDQESVNFKHDFYEDELHATIDIYLKGLEHYDVFVQFTEKCIELAIQEKMFRIILGNSICTLSSSYEITDYKLILKCKKDQQVMWNSASIEVVHSDISETGYASQVAQSGEASETDVLPTENELTEFESVFPVRPSSAPPNHVDSLYNLNPIYQSQLNLALVRPCRSTSPTPLHSQTEFSQLPEKPQEHCCGLDNHGVDCFINTIIQCLASISDLSAYFLEDHYLQDINTTNPISNSKGEMALSFGQLIKKLFASDGSISPSNFKESLMKFWPIYDPWQQQDAQEFLGYILDSIHEDVNKVLKKPYIELPDFDDSADDDKVSKVFWDAHLKRDDSIIVDLFHGQYKSVITCQNCRKTSVKFDPFMSLTMELPSMDVQLQFYMVDKENRKTFCRVHVNPDSKASDLIEMFDKNGVNSYLFASIDTKNRRVNELIDKNTSAQDLIGKYELFFIFECIPNQKNVFISHLRTENFTPFGFPQLININPESPVLDGPNLYSLILMKLVERKTLSITRPENDLFQIYNLGQRSYIDEENGLDIESGENFALTLIWKDESYNLYDERMDSNSTEKAIDTAEREITLDLCFKEHLKQEEMDEVYCSNCKSHEKGLKKLDLWKLPKVLVIHLKRFIMHPRTGSWTKQNVNVAYPINDVPFGELCLDPNMRNKKYELFATSNHRGSINSGHYTAYCKRGKWYEFDDETFTSLSDENIVTPNGYLLYYRLLE